MCDCYSVINPSSTVCVSITDPGMTLMHIDLTVRGLVATLVLARMRFGFDVVDALGSRCRVEDFCWLDGLNARHDEECSMSVYLSRRG